MDACEGGVIADDEGLVAGDEAEEFEGGGFLGEFYDEMGVDGLVVGYQVWDLGQDVDL